MSWPSFPTSVAIALAALLAGAIRLIFYLLRENGRLLLRLEERDASSHKPPGLQRGSVASDFALPTLAGGVGTLGQHRGRRVLVAFVHPDCTLSQELVERVGARLAEGSHPDLVPLFVTSGPADKASAMFESIAAAPVHVLVQEGSEVAAVYGVPGTPSGYVIDETGCVASELLLGVDPLLSAFGWGEKTAVNATAPFSPSAVASRLVRDGLTRGTPAPDFTLSRLEGGEVSLNQYRGRRVLLVFSDPDCPPCNGLMAHLEEIHRSRRDLQVLMVSRGDLDANLRKQAEFGVTFPIVRQRHWEVSRAYGMFATPIAFLVNPRGVLASDVAVGAERILELSSRLVVARRFFKSALAGSST
jgi:peroxiredoxin